MNILFKQVDRFTLTFFKKNDLYLETMMGNVSTNNAFREVCTIHYGDF